MALFSYPLIVSLDAMGSHLDAILAFCGTIAIAWRGWRWSVKVSNKVDSINSIPPETLKTLANNIDAITELVGHELNHNSGSSVKDKAYDAVTQASRAADAAETAAKGVQEVSEHVQEVSAQLQSFMVSHYDENRAIWAAIGRRETDRRAEDS